MVGRNEAPRDNPYELWTAPSEVLDPALFSDTFDASPEGLALASHGRILYANPAFVSLFGYSSPSEVAGRPLTDFRMSPDSHDCVLLNTGETARIRNGNPLCDFLGRRKDGSPVRVESACSALRSESLKFVLLTVRDVSQREVHPASPLCRRYSPREFPPLERVLADTALPAWQAFRTAPSVPS